MEKLFKVKNIKKFFGTLSSLDRHNSKVYKGIENQRSVFIKRTLKHLKGRYFKVLLDNRDNGTQNAHYVIICNITFGYGHSDSIVFQLINEKGAFLELNLQYNDLISLRGEEISIDVFNKISELFKVEYPNCEGCHKTIPFNRLHNDAFCESCACKNYILSFYLEYLPKCKPYTQNLENLIYIYHYTENKWNLKKYKRDLYSNTIDEINFDEKFNNKSELLKSYPFLTFSDKVSTKDELVKKFK